MARLTKPLFQMKSLRVKNPSITTGKVKSPKLTPKAVKSASWAGPLKAGGVGGKEGVMERAFANFQEAR